MWSSPWLLPGLLIRTKEQAVPRYIEEPRYLPLLRAQVSTFIEEPRYKEELAGGAGAGWSRGGAAMGEEPALQSVLREGRWGSWGSRRQAFGEKYESDIETRIEAHIEAHIEA